MIFTVTCNSAIDKVFLIEELTPGLPLVARKVVTSVGGKGLDSSVVLRHLGVETVGLSFMAGETGKELENLLRRYGIISDTVWVSGETRTCYVIAESKAGRVTHIKYGELTVHPEQVEQFLARYMARLREASWVIISGSVPASVPISLYGDLVSRASQAGVSSLVDSSRETILAALPYKPKIVKMNWEEFEWTFNTCASGIEDLVAKAGKVYCDHQMEALVLTCGKQGILAITGERILRARAPEQPVKNSAGAGDAVSSALVWRLSLGDGWAEALRWAAAASAAVVRTEGTADCHRNDVLEILTEVEIIHEVL